MIEVIRQYLDDPNANDMFITGKAGTGKTTSLAQLVEYCLSIGLEVRVCAHTHKACGILRSKLPDNVYIETLHKFLRKRPTINVIAEEMKHVEGNTQFEKPEPVDVLFLDEFSQVGERDLMSLREMQDEAIEGEEPRPMRIIWIGDLNQLPPVKDQQTITPNGKYWIKLTANRRLTNAKSPLLEVLDSLVDYIEGTKKPEPLKPNSHFIRSEANIAGSYKIDPEQDKIILAYTNARVEELNREIQGYEEPLANDKLFSPSMHEEFTLVEIVDRWRVREINIRNGEILRLGSKFRTLEFMLDSDMCEFFRVRDADDEEFTFAAIFGTNQYKLAREQASKSAVELNKKITEEYNPDNVAQWAQINRGNKLARQRNLAWRYYLTLNDSVMCFDFNHAMTVHKAQGSTRKHVYLDTEDIGRCADYDFNLYLKLLYVGISRASEKVWTN